MLFVANAESYRVIINPGKHKLTPVTDPDTGMTENVMVMTTPYMKAEFRSLSEDRTSGGGMIDFYAREFARRRFETPSEFNGELPGRYRRGGVIDTSDPEFGGMVYEGSEPKFFYSWFDTDTDIPEYETSLRSVEEIKALFEERLLSGVGPGYVLVEREAIPAPWPRYPDLVLKAGVTKERLAQQIVDLAGQVGVPLADVMLFERAHENRDWLVERLAEATIRQAEEAAEDEAMSVRA